MFSSILNPLIIGLSLAAPVGPLNVEAIKRGIQYGFWTSWLIGIGGLAADIGFMVLICYGGSPLMTQPAVQIALQYFGFAMLTAIGLYSIQIKPQPHHIPLRSERIKGRMQSFATGFVISALNPINIFFWLTIYGSILSEHVVEGDTRFLWLNGCIVFTGVALWYFNVALTVHFGRRLLKPKLLRLLTFGAGLILIGYGIRCAILGTRQLMHWF